MTSQRIQALERMLASRPDDPRLRSGLALEYEKEGRLDDAVRELSAYLDQSEDEGNAWGRLGALRRRLGDEAGAREAYRRGIEQAGRHGHPSMVAELEAALEE